MSWHSHPDNPAFDDEPDEPEEVNENCLMCGSDRIKSISHSCAGDWFRCNDCGEEFEL